MLCFYPFLFLPDEEIIVVHRVQKIDKLLNQIHSPVTIMFSKTNMFLRMFTYLEID